MWISWSETYSNKNDGPVGQQEEGQNEHPNQGVSIASPEASSPVPVSAVVRVTNGITDPVNVSCEKQTPKIILPSVKAPIDERSTLGQQKDGSFVKAETRDIIFHSSRNLISGVIPVVQEGDAQDESEGTGNPELVAQTRLILSEYIVIGETNPGALRVFPSGDLRQRNDSPISFFTEATPGQMTLVPTDLEEGQHPDPATLIVADSSVLLSNGDGDHSNGDEPIIASLVPDTVLASAQVFDTEADDKRRHRRRLIGFLGVLAILCLVIALSVVLSRRNNPQEVTSIPTPVPSPIPTGSPTTNLFGFLAENSFDGGEALSTSGSPQQHAMHWLMNQTGLSSQMNYHLLQYYALVTLYYRTSGANWVTSQQDLQSIVAQSTPNMIKGQWLNSNPSFNGFCTWHHVFCNLDFQVTSLQLSYNKLVGSIPAELAILHPTISKPKCACHCFFDFLKMFLTRYCMVSANIDLSGNSIDGDLPSSLGLMSSLGT